jgi:hypothetical protein
MQRLLMALMGIAGVAATALAAEDALITFPEQAKLRQHDEAKVVLVRFGEQIERRSFRALLNGKDVTALVELRPGRQAVALPFTTGLNEVVFKARRATTPQAPLEEARYTVRYRPPGDIMIRARPGVSTPSTPASQARLEEMREAMEAGDMERFRRLQAELSGAPPLQSR